MISNGPAHDFAATGVDDHAAVSPSVAGSVLADVLGPDPFWTIISARVLHEIVVGFRVGAMPARTAMRDPVETSAAREACHAFTADPKTQALAWPGTNPRGSVRASRIVVNLHEQDGKATVVDPSC